MAIEVESLKSQMCDLKTVNQTGMDFFEGTLDGLNCVIVECGVGKVNAALCVQILCDRFQVTHIVDTGVAGSLCNELDIGDLVISENVMYHGFDCSPMGYAIGQVPRLPVLRFPADETLCKFAVAAVDAVYPGHCKVGTVASGDQFVSNPQVKERIISHTGALCTEMEGAAIAHAAWRNGVPFVVIRAISDKADDSAQMDYPSFEVMAADRCAAVTRVMGRCLCEL
jgi:adenosylhomocysteine nucleosidase